MSDSQDCQPIIVRTELGLSIRGTRKTIYQVMDFVTAGWSPERIRDIMCLTDEEIDGVMRYIDEHREEVDAEYRQVLEIAEENRRYWEERNRDLIDELASLPPDTKYPEARAKLAALRAQRR
jgi:uncharacterized protein (DUF433 family)